MLARRFRNLNPIQLLALGYLSLTAFSTLLLLLPISRTRAISLSVLDELFTAVSVITTTGLVVHNTSDYTLFGQLVILALIQIAGLGYMMFVALLVLTASGRLGFGARMLLRESIGRPTSFDILKFIKLILIYSAVIEVAGAAALTYAFSQDTSGLQALYSGIFHSVSAFCTAGFSIYPDSMTAYSKSGVVNLTINAVSILGAIGFFVMHDFVRWGVKCSRAQRPRRLSAHTKLTTLVTFLLLAFSIFAVYEIESAHGVLPANIVDTVFQVISASSTAGFNTIDVGKMTTGALFVIVMLMLVGGSPGSTAGGIKTTTFGIMLAFVPSVLLDRTDIHMFKRRIATPQINKSFAMGLIALLWVALATTILGFTENTPIIALLFEVTSALSTVGLSAGVTPTLTSVGKLVIIATMLVGRIGTLGIGYSLIGKARALDYHYPNADVLVG